MRGMKRMALKRKNGMIRSGLKKMKAKRRKKKLKTKFLMNLKKHIMKLKLSLQEQRSNELKWRKLEVSSRKESHQKIETKE